MGRHVYPNKSSATLMSLTCKDLTVSVNGRILVRDLSLSAEPSAFICILGPNGVGKTLTLHTLAGIRDFKSGCVRLRGDDMQTLDRRVIAQRLGLLLQAHDDAFPMTVLEAAMMGRHPHLGFWQWEAEADLDVAKQALADMDLGDLTKRLTSTLSGGERRRLAIATLLVQEPDMLLLDEPMNHLDPLHKLQVLSQLSALADSGKTIIASLHDPAMAARFARQILLLFGDGKWEFGSTAEMLTTDRLERLYGTPFAAFSRDEQTVLLPTL
jgi:iron complex transport system ATP-binding protein